MSTSRYGNDVYGSRNRFVNNNSLAAASYGAQILSSNANGSPGPANSPSSPAATAVGASNIIGISVSTPANNLRALQSLNYRTSRPSAQYQHSMFPSASTVAYGQGTTGVQLRERIQMSLESGLEDDYKWAIHSLVQVSHLHPDWFPLKQNLTALDSLLNAVIASPLLVAPSALSTFASSMKAMEESALALEIVLIIRNTALDPENGQLLSVSPKCREIVVCGLTGNTQNAEFTSYCSDIAEAISIHITPLSEDDALFRALVSVVASTEDRALLIAALRSVAKLVIRDKSNLLKSVFSRDILLRIVNFLLVEDEELIAATLDVIYQYTAYAENVDILLEDVEISKVVPSHLVRLLTYKLKEGNQDFIRLERRTKKPVPTEPPKLSDAIVQELLEYSEPERATHWIRTAYQADPDGEVTQISLWNAYRAQFEEFSKVENGQWAKLLPAVDFIKNVTTAVKTSAAMLVPLPDGTRRFIIKGIRPREYPVPPSEVNAANARKAAAPKEVEPASFSVSATLVLQNISKTSSGKSVLNAYLPPLIEASLRNRLLPAQVYQLLTEMSDKATDVDKN